MAHYAEVVDGVVTQVIVAEQDHIDTLAGQWVQTSYNTHGGVHANGGTPLRKNYATIGYTYDAGRDAFIPPSPDPTWVIDEQTCLWVPPIPYPTDGKSYEWDKVQQSWVEVYVGNT